MPAYAGFKSIRDYLDSRFARDSTNQNAVSVALKLRRNYLNSIYHGHFTPSIKRCDQIAAHFGDDPHIVRVLVGRESPPPDLNDKVLRAIYDLSKSLPPAKRKQALKLLRQLSDE